MTPHRIRVLELSGTPYQMGVQHGRAHRETIRRFAEERIGLAGDPAWVGRSVPREEVLALAEACAEAHRRYSPALSEELRGMAEATGLTLAELVVVGGFTDFIDTVWSAAGARAPAPSAADNCTAFLVPNARGEGGRGFLGQTWDMHAGATPHVILLRGAPAEAPPFLAFSTVGCLGMIGMNALGVAVGINNLLGADGRVGVTWPLVVRQMLTCRAADEALEVLLAAPLAGAHNYLILDASGRGFNVEATATTHHVTPLEGEALVHTNHCLTGVTRAAERVRDPDSQASSEARLAHARALLSGDSVTVEALQALTRDERAICIRPTPPKFVETCGAALMRPATGDFWAVWGLPSEHAYEHFRV
jgi:isopenicillin-N N-acyltransferase-like protein